MENQGYPYSFSKKFTALSVAMGLLILAPAAQALETDNFTDRAKVLALPDALNRSNMIVNGRLDVAMAEANSQGKCDADALIARVRAAVDRNPVGEVEAEIELDRSIARSEIIFDKSVYSHLPEHASTWNPNHHGWFLSGLLLGSIKLNGQIVGIDKLGHFFGQGYEYFTSADWQAALKNGIRQEGGVYGNDMSGVFSYGDLNANFQGYRFWLNLVDGPNPYFKCDGEKFKRVRGFDWAEYVSPMWDEALNCSEYTDDTFSKGFEQGLKERGLKCPVDPSACAEMVKHPCAAFLVSPQCFKVTGTSKVENLSACQQHIKKTHGPATESCGYTESTKRSIAVGADDLWGFVSSPVFFIQQKYQSGAK